MPITSLGTVLHLQQLFACISIVMMEKSGGVSGTNSCPERATCCRDFVVERSMKRGWNCWKMTVAVRIDGEVGFRLHGGFQVDWGEASQAERVIWIAWNWLVGWSMRVVCLAGWVRRSLSLPLPRSWLVLTRQVYSVVLPAHDRPLHSGYPSDVLDHSNLLVDRSCLPLRVVAVAPKPCCR